MHEDPALRNLPPSAAAAAAGHEVADITLGGIRNFLIILFGTIAITLVLMAFLYSLLNKYEMSQEEPQSTLVKEVPVPPSPMLQPSRYHNTLDATDLNKFHEVEDNTINHTYAWIGPDKQAARIPIEDAMKLLLAKGLPARSNGTSGGGTSSGEGSNLQLPPTGGAAGLMINSAHPLEHAPPIPHSIEDHSQ
ncbi:MAG: hypothetical protein JO353_06320 [Phycisphaerae bacterium]|nr:hypothetical protein [Phycisphaerae bacterium]